jgi:hypothetical protein
MKNSYILLGMVAFCASCSSTNLMSLSVTEPAPVSLSPNVRSAAVINRSRAADGSKTFDAIHKTLSLESKDLQEEGAKASATGLADELKHNSRFAYIKFLDNLDLRSYGAGVFPAALPWDSVEKICRESSSDLLFSLELFDAESKVGYNGISTNIPSVVGNIATLGQQVSMNTQVRTGWRIYDPVSRNILDEYIISRDLSFQGTGLGPATAGSGLVGRKEAVKQAAGNAGQAYATRILPYSIRVSRFYYVRGDRNFIIAKRMAQTGNWDGAAKIWQQETTSSSRKAAGRACYNMAIISEINGDVNGAITWAQKAYEVYNLRLGLSYVNVLRHRQDDNAVLQSQNQSNLTSNP